MPGHAGGPYWATVDFESDGEDPTSPINQRMYLDPWDNEMYGVTTDSAKTIPVDNSFVGEPVSASFYYVPTKNYESEDEASIRGNVISPIEMIAPAPDYSIYGTNRRRRSKAMVHDIHPDMLYERSIRSRRRSLYTEEPMYAHSSMIYEPLYGSVIMPPPPGYLPPRSRMSLPHPDIVSAALMYGKRRRTSRMTDAYEHFAYETLSPEYEDWARPLPKAAPDNFHLSRYGHLQIDYSCSWNSLDRLIRNQ